jgi:hypothetical protein
MFDEVVEEFGRDKRGGGRGREEARRGNKLGSKRNSGCVERT